MAFFTFAGFASTLAQSKPAWVESPSSVYPDRLYVSAVGAGPDRQSAERNAIAALTAFFRQSVTSRVIVVDSERQVNGASFSKSNMSQSIEASAALDSLIGAEIRETWNDTENHVWYAAAAMDRNKCAGLYAAELDKTVNEVKSLTAMPGGPTFESAARCKLARELAAKAGDYALVLVMLGGVDRQSEVSALAAATADALDKARMIPVDVRVKGDSGGRIKAAFASVLTTEGFKTGGRNSRYVLEVTFSRSPAPKNTYFNTRYTVDAVLIDTGSGTELFTFNIADRESHTAGQEDADNRALLGAQRKISETFPPVLRAYPAY
jgi:hypothetical protein